MAAAHGETRHAGGAAPPAPGLDEDALAIAIAIAGLPEKYREVILLYYYQDMTMQEAAFALKTAPSTIAKRLGRARDLLRRELEVTGHEG